MPARWVLWAVGMFTTASPVCTFAADEERLESFQEQLDALRQSYRIPGMSAAILKNQQPIWEASYGYADVERRIPVTPDTPFLVASLTKTFASVLLMQCVEAGTLNLDTPIQRYTTAIPESGVTVRHLFTHTSESRPPGESYRYNGSRYAALTAVVDSCSGMPFRVALAKRILNPLQMESTMPGKDTGNPPPTPLAGLFDEPALERYARALQRLAKPYRLDSRGQPLLAPYPQEGINASAGVISTVRDLAKYDAAIDEYVLLRSESQAAAWRNHRNGRGQTLPYGLGWFVQQARGLRLIWHYGQWDTFSALLLKVPDRGLTFLLLCNSDGVSAPFQSLGAGDVTGSAFADLFLRMISEPGVLRMDTPALRVNGVVNGADYSPGVARGGWVSIFGQNLAAAKALWTDVDTSGGALPTTLADTTVQVNGTAAQLAFVGPGQVNFLVPASASAGSARIDVLTAKGNATATAAISLVAPALFSHATTAGRVVAGHHADGVMINRDRPGTPARRGETITVYCTGCGDTEQAVGGAERATVTIGEKAAGITYIGVVALGVHQINLRVPEDLPDGDHVIKLGVGDARSSDTVAIPIEGSL